MKRNLLHIDEIRFLVIHLILINHWSLNLYIMHTAIDKTLINYWFDLTSPCLALISGYLFFYKTADHFGYVKKVKTRFHSLVIPYLFWTLTFFFLYALIKEEYIHIFHHTIWYAPVEDISLKNLLENIVHPPLVNFWYLQNLVLILPFNYFIYYLLKNRYVFGAVFLFIIAVYAFNLMPLYFQSRFLPYYLLGCFLGYREVYIPKVPLNRVITLLLLPVLFFMTTETSDLPDANLLNLCLKILIAVFFICCVYNMLDANQESYVFRYLKKYKVHSFFLFAINMFLFSIVQRTLLSLGAARYLDNKYFSLFFLIVSLTLVLVLAFAIAGFLKKRFSKFYYVITGR